MKRTLKQNKTYWKWLSELSNELTAHGVDMKKSVQAPIMATPEILHTNVTHKLIKDMFDKESTADLTTTEMSQVAKVMTDAFSTMTKGLVSVPFVPELSEGEQAVNDF